MQKIATRLFIIASVIFGITGIAIVFTARPDTPDGEPDIILVKILFTCVFIILPSFALSVASKYLSNRSE
jgi:hypothetical protein